MNGKFSLKLLCAAVASACAGSVLAGPVGPTVSTGAATFNPVTLVVTSTAARTTINWQSFVVSRNEVVNFVLPNAQSTVLNQVFNSFSIQGSVTSNGSVLFMSNGLVSGSGVNVDIAGMLTSSVRFSQGALSAIHASALSTQVRPSATVASGRVLVISDDGLALSSSGGDVMLNPGKTVELAEAASPHLRVQVSAPSGVAINISRLVGNKTDGSIYAGLFRVPAAARQAVDTNGDGVQTAAAGLGPKSTGAERFYRYAEAVFARMLSDYTQALNDEAAREGDLVKVASVSTDRMVLPETKSRQSVMPLEIEIGARRDRGATGRTAADTQAVRQDAGAVEVAMAPSIPLRDIVATIEPQPMAVAAKSDLELNGALILASIRTETMRDVVATIEPQPVTAAAKSDLELNGALILASIPAAAVRDIVATIEPQQVAVSAKSDLELNSALILASIPVEPVRDIVATIEPHPVPVAVKSDLELNSALILAAIPAPAKVAPAQAMVAPAPAVIAAAPLTVAPVPAAKATAMVTAQKVELTLVAGLEVDPGQGRFERPVARGPVIVVAAAGQDAASRQQASDSDNLKSSREESRRTPRIMTDFRGAIFHM